MASQCAMIEIVSGSESSESIINISNSQSSGASSIFAVSSSSSATITTIDKLKAEVEHLRKDNKVLEGRLRGAKALGDLLAESQKEIQQLKLQLAANSNSSNSQPTVTMTSSENHPSVRSPFSLVSNQAMQQVPQTELNNLSLGSNAAKGHVKTAPEGHKDLAVAYPPVIGPPSSMQETTGPPDWEETKVVSSPTSRGPMPLWQPKNSPPKQESLNPASLSNSADLLHYDSDKYEEATYEKVGRGLTGTAGTQYASGGSGSSRAEGRPTDFPSLASELSNGTAQPPSHTSSTHPPYMAMLHQSQLSGHVNSGLAAEVESITERLNSEPADSTAAIALQMHQIAERISKKEQKERDQKKLIETLLRENQAIKKQWKMSEVTLQNEIFTLREHNTNLMQQLKGSKSRDEQVAVKPVVSNSDWVHVERPLGDSSGSDLALVDRIRKLEQDKAELQRANSNWKAQWDNFEKKHQVQLSELRSQLIICEQDLSNLRRQQSEQAPEFESRMLELKKRISEEEMLKEEALHKQLLAERQCSELQDQLAELKTQLSDTARDRQTLSTELNILKAQLSASGPQTSKPGTDSATAAALRTEIAMLKEQLKVFAEDFEHEREDRTMAQAARDTAKKNYETLKVQNQQLSSQVRNLQKQVKDRDDTIAWTLRQSESLQQQLSELKKKASSEWTEKQNLQRILALTQQQLQQVQRSRFALPQNPYSSEPPRRTFQTSQAAPSSAPWQAPQSHMMSPEHLPGAWTCSACTFINYPGRTVCDSCGYVNSPTRSYPEHNGYSSQDPYGSGHALLMSRGNNDQRTGSSAANGGDLVIDSGIWHPPANY